MSFVADLAQIVEKLVPTIVVIDDYERGVEYRRGHVNRTPLPPNWYWNLPANLRRVVPVPIKPQWIDLPFQSLETSDGIPVTLSVNLGYEVTDAVVWQNDTQDAEQTLMNLTRPAVAEVVTAAAFASLAGDLESAATKILRKVRHPASKVGARVTGVGFTDFARARNYRLLQE